MKKFLLPTLLLSLSASGHASVIDDLTGYIDKSKSMPLTNCRTVHIEMLWSPIMQNVNMSICDFVSMQQWDGVD